MKLNSVAVIIPAYNAERYIAETIDSVIAQTYSDWEMIVVDDGSTDNTKNIVNEYVKQDSRIKYIYQENASQAVARNTGIKYSNGEFIAFLDADDIWMPDKIERQIRLFEDSSVGLAYTLFVKIDSNSILIPSRNAQVKCFKGNVYKNIIYDNFLATSSVILRAGLLSSNGLLFRTGRQGVEDWDLWVRMAQITQFDYIAEPLLRYRVYPGNQSSDILRMHESRMKTLDDLESSFFMNGKLTENEIAELRSILKKGRSLHVLRAAHILLSEDRKQARSFFFHALRLHPFSLHNIWGVIKSYIYL